MSLLLFIPVTFAHLLSPGWSNNLPTHSQPTTFTPPGSIILLSAPSQSSDSHSAQLSFKPRKTFLVKSEQPLLYPPSELTTHFCPYNSFLPKTQPNLASAVAGQHQSVLITEHSLEGRCSRAGNHQWTAAVTGTEQRGNGHQTDQIKAWSVRMRGNGFKLTEVGYYKKFFSVRVVRH